MNPNLSENTQAILLLTAPLIVGRGQSPADLLSPGEYKRLARHLHQLSKVPADLLSVGAEQIFGELQSTIDSERLKGLMARGLALTQALDRWQTRSIWMVSRADPEYPQLLKDRLKDDRPAVIYGCGDRSILDFGGLAVVGSRDVDDALIEYTQSVGRLAAKAGKVIVSGGARGIDQAAMRGALNAGGTVIGVMADSLEKAAMNRDHREMLMDGKLVLISPYDPGAGFNVGNAMQRNKLIYALSDAALVVNSDHGKGGTWAGAVDQLDKLRLVPVYVRSGGAENKAFSALLHKGAFLWPNPTDADGLVAALRVENSQRPASQSPIQPGRLDASSITPEPSARIAPDSSANAGIADQLAEQQKVSDPIQLAPADTLFAAVKHGITLVLITPKKEAEIADAIKVTKAQTREWLQRLIESGHIEKAKGSFYQLRKGDLIDLCSADATAISNHK